MNSTFVSVIPKPGKNTSDVANYRPISLINNDLKILPKILASRMLSFIVRYIYKDQAGFIPERQGPDQIMRAIDIISLLRSQYDGGTPQEGFFSPLTFKKLSTLCFGHISLTY